MSQTNKTPQGGTDGALENTFNTQAKAPNAWNNKKPGGCNNSKPGDNTKKKFQGGTKGLEDHTFYYGKGMDTKFVTSMEHILNYIGKKYSSSEEVSIEKNKIILLVSLKKLDLNESGIKSLPPSIGRLHNLEELDLRFVKNLMNLPEEIGDLVSLKKLDLSNSGIKSLPPSIGRLHNLEELDLQNTCHLLSLPKEIGDLVSLKRLELDLSGIEFLPPSIGRLHNLEELHLGSTDTLLSLPEEIGDLVSLKKFNLRCTYKLLSLPKEIGDLVSLEKLDLNYSGIKSLPPSIGQLHNLKDLDLGGTRLLSLPEEIGDLVSLKKLDLSNSGIKSLPPSIGRLHNLEELDLQSTCHLLSLPEEIGNLELWYALACNRARSRIGFETIHEAPTLMTPKLWPLLLNCAPSAFHLYSFDEDFDELYPDDCGITKPDAIYRILVLGRESFIGVLLNRKAKDAPTRMRETLTISSPARKKIRRS